MMEYQFDYVFQSYLEESLGYSREELPQIELENIPDIILHFVEKEIGVKKISCKLSSLKPSQIEFNEDKILRKIATESGQYKSRKYIKSSDGYIIDGHHDWAHGIEVDEEAVVDCIEIDLPAKSLIKRLKLLKITTQKNLEDEIVKAELIDLMAEEIGELLKAHKYIRREGTRGNYRYFYQEESSDDLGYETNPLLKTKSQKKIERKAGEYLHKNYKEAKKKYIEKFGTLLNTDDVRELIEDYRKDRTTNSQSVHRPCSAFTDKMFKEFLAKKPAEESTVIFSAGGSGAGKTTGIMKDEQLRSILNVSEFGRDSNMTDFEESRDTINSVIESGRSVSLIYTYRDPMEAFEGGVLRRVLDPDNGRAVPAIVHAKSHIKSRETFEKIFEEFSGNEKVTIFVVDNSRGLGNAKRIDFEDFLKIPRKDEDSVLAGLKVMIKKWRKDGRITEKQANALWGGKVDRTPADGDE